MQSSIHSKERYDRRLIIAIGSGREWLPVSASIVDWLLLLPQQPCVSVSDLQSPKWPLRRLFADAERQPAYLDGLREIVLDGAKFMDAVARVLCSETSHAVVSYVDCGDARPSAELIGIADHLGIRVTYVLSAEPRGTLPETLTVLLDEVGRRADYLIVQSRSASTSDTSPELERAIYEYGAAEARFPRLPPEVARYLVGELDGRPHSLAQAAEQRRDAFVNSRAQMLWVSWSAQLDAARHVLLPTQHA